MVDLFGDALPRLKVPRYERTFAVTNFVRPEGWAPLDDWPELHGHVALDLETLDPGLAGGRGSSWVRPDEGRVCGFGFKSRAAEGYVPVAHAEGNVDPDRAFRWLAAQAQKPEVTFVYANAPYDIGWLSKRHGITFANLPVDVQAMAALLDETKYTYALDALGKEHLGRGKSTDELEKACLRGGLVNPLGRMDLVPAWLAEAYGLEDCDLTLGVFEKLLPQIVENGLDQVLELERECALVAVDLKSIGVRVDLDRAERLIREFEQQKKSAIKVIHDLTRVHVSATDLKSLVRALKVEQPDIQLPTTPTGKESIAADVLDALPDSPVSIQIKLARQLDKAVGTFLKGYIIGHEYRGRVHADFNPLRNRDEKTSGGATGGRWSSQNPNMQNIPVRTKIGLEVRRCFVADLGEDWVKFDYASQEPRLTIHYASLVRDEYGRPLRGAQAMIDRFNANPLTDLHLETALLMFGHTSETWEMLTREDRKLLRGRAKIINLAIAYGAGGGNIADQLGLPTEMKSFEKNGRTIRYRGAGEEAERLLRIHFQRLPWLKQLQQIAKQRAEERGFVRTIFDRMVRFGPSLGGSFLRTHKALNAVIQGSAADQMKMAQCLLRREGIPMLVCVHDEVDISVPRGASAYINRVKQIMEAAVRLKLPVIADAKIAENWGEVSVD